jgi:hypothetical protein
MTVNSALLLLDAPYQWQNAPVTSGGCKETSDVVRNFHISRKHGGGMNRMGEVRGQEGYHNPGCSNANK